MKNIEAHFIVSEDLTHFYFFFKYSQHLVPDL